MSAETSPDDVLDALDYFPDSDWDDDDGDIDNVIDYYLKDDDDEAFWS